MTNTTRYQRADNRRSDWYDMLPGKTCSTCNGGGSKTDSRGRHIDACPTCRGFGKTEH
jgi:DnaJ-class molecular chaperone